MENTNHEMSLKGNWMKDNTHLKRMAVVSDLSCYGRCALTVALPIISAMGIECCPIPTVVLSTNGAFPGYVTQNMSEFMKKVSAHFETLGLSFDGIVSGFYNSPHQIAVTEEMFRKVKNERERQPLIFVDPIMGDHGKLYSVSTSEIVSGLCKLLSYADVITPNLTECCALLGTTYPRETPSEKDLINMTERLHELGPKRVIITGLDRGDTIENFVSDQGETHSILTLRIGGDRSGTGDVFLSVLAGSMVAGIEFLPAVKKATDFLSKAIVLAEQYQLPPNSGVCFEQCLSELYN